MPTHEYYPEFTPTRTFDVVCSNCGTIRHIWETRYQPIAWGCPRCRAQHDFKNPFISKPNNYKNWKDK